MDDGAVVRETLHFTAGEPSLGTGTVVDAIAVSAPKWTSGPHGEQGDRTLGSNLTVCRAISISRISLSLPKYLTRGRVMAILSHIFLLYRGGAQGQKLGTLLMNALPGKSQPGLPAPKPP